MRFLPLLLFPSLAAAEPLLPAGSEVSPAVYVDITRSGLSQVKVIANSVLPATVELDAISQADQVGFGLAGGSYEFSVSNLVVYPVLEQLTIDPHDPRVCREVIGGSDLMGNGYLAVDARLQVSLGSTASPVRANVNVDGNLLGFIDFGILDEDCDIVMDDKSVTATLNLVTGPKRNAISCRPELTEEGCMQPEVLIEDFDWSMEIDSIDDFDLDCDSFLDVILDVADFLNIDPVDLMLASFEPTIETAIEDVIAEAEPQIAEALLAFNTETEIALTGEPSQLSTCVSDMFTDNRGIRIELAGLVEAAEEPHECVGSFDPGGSLVTIPPIPPRFPELADAGVPFDEHIALMVNDDFINQLLYTVWFNGTLCAQISDESSPVELPIPINTDLFDLLAGGLYDDLFPNPEPMLMVTRPEAPPTVRTIQDGENFAAIELREFGVDFYGDLEGRASRLAGMNLDLDAALALDFDGQGGTIDALIDFDAEEVITTVVFNDLKPEANTQIENGFGAVLDLLAGPLLEEALAGFSFDLPSFSGLGVQEAVLTGAGPIKDFFGIFGNMGPVSYGDPGGGCALFGDEGGSEGGDCGLGCTTGTLPSRMLPIFALLLISVRRRREGP